MNQPAKTAKHPKALYVLFLTEMWERFAYYLLAGLLLIYLMDSVHGGKGMTEARASDITGTFLALIWLPLFLGGYIADRYLGYVKSIFVGGGLLAAGYLTLTLPGNSALFAGLGLVVVGNSFFKPNISTLLGNIYKREDLEPLKDNAYNIFYMGINIGGSVCNFAAAYLRNKYGFGYAFGAAGVGMIIGLVIFALNLKQVRSGDVKKEPLKGDMPLSRILLYVFLPGIVAAVIGYIIPGKLFGTTLMGSQSNDAFVFACIPVISFFISLYIRAKGKDKKGIGTLLFIFAISILFWALYYQNFTAYTIWAEKHTDRTLSTTGQKIADHLGLMQTAKRGDPYFDNMPKEQWPAAGQEVKLVNAELFQAIGPLLIVVLTPLILVLFSTLRNRGREPSTASKFGIALFISSLSALVMVFAVLSVPSIYHYKVSAWWLWGTYFVITVAEIFLSPMGLSLVSKVAPVRLTSLMMGGWFLTMSLGSKISGVMTSAWNKFPDKTVYFLIWVVAAIIGGVLIFSRVRSLNQTIRENEETI